MELSARPTATFGLQSCGRTREVTHCKADAQPVSSRTHWRSWPFTVMGTRIPQGRDWELEDLAGDGDLSGFQDTELSVLNRVELRLEREKSLRPTDRQQGAGRSG